MLLIGMALCFNKNWKQIFILIITSATLDEFFEFIVSPFPPLKVNKSHHWAKYSRQ